MTLFGVDLSDYDRGRGPVNVADMARDGMSMLTHKATEGTKTRHKYLKATLDSARAVGIPYLGAYAVPRTPGNGGHGPVASQVDFFLSTVDAALPWWDDHPTWFWQVDLEHWGYDDVPPRYGVEMAERLYASTGRPVLLYAPRWAYRDTIGGSAPLWASAYGTNPVLPYRDAYRAAGGDKGSGWTPYSGRTPLVWQFGSKTRIGTQPGCDANAIRDEARFRALFTDGGTTLTTMDPGDRQLLQDTYNWSRAAVTGRTADGTDFVDPWDGGGPYGNRQIAEKLDALAEQVGAAPTVGGEPLDYDRLADLVVDRLAARLQATPQQQS